MTRQSIVTFAITLAVAGLPLAGVASAQERTSNGNTTGTAVPRSDGGGTAAPRSDGGGGSSAGNSSGSSGDVSGGTSSSGWSAPSSPTSAASAWSSFEAPRRSDDQGTRSRGSSGSTGSATPRSGSGGSPRGGSTSSGRSASGPSGQSGPPRQAVPSYSRPREGRQVTGEAVERGSVPGGGGYPSYPSYPYYPYYPWGFWGPGYGFGLGYLYYDPWFSSYGYGYGYPGGYAGYGGGGGGYAVSESYRDNGSVRLKINPKDAQIYIDGFFVGVVDSYDGSFQKLNLEGGSHRVELKAEGYEPLEFEVLITPGETVTYKGEMKRIK